MRGGPRGFIHRSTCDVLLRIPLIPTLDFVYRAFTFSGQPFQAVLLSSMVEYDVVLQPRRNTFGLGSIRFRSPLLTESISLSFPPLTEMFHFSGFRVSYPMYSGMNDRVLPRSGYPIRISPDHRLLAASRGFSQLAASFFACWHQGIHRTPLLTSSYCKAVTTSTIPQSPFVTYCIVSLLGMHVYLVFCSCCSTTHFVGKRLLLSNRFLCHADVNFRFPSIIDFVGGPDRT